MDTLHVPEFKKNAKEEGAIIVYGDEASFRQSPTLHQTWAPVIAQPKVLSKGQRNSQFNIILEYYPYNEESFIFKPVSDRLNAIYSSSFFV